MANFFHGHKTAASGTAIQVVIPPVDGLIARITKLGYTADVTEHTGTILRPIGSTTVSMASTSGLSTLQLTSIEPGTTTSGADESLAANDYVCWVDDKCTWHADMIASISGTTITLTNALAEDVSLGAPVYAMYELARATNRQVKFPASTRVEIPGPIQAGYGKQTGICEARSGLGDPLVLTVDNITNAGSLNYVIGNYVTNANQVMM